MAIPAAHWRNGRGADPRMPDTVEVMNAGLPIVAPHAASSMSTTGRGQLPSVWFRNSSGDSSWNLIRRPRTSPMMLTGSVALADHSGRETGGASEDEREVLERSFLPRQLATEVPIPNE
jgi:hypothetical protein